MTPSNTGSDHYKGKVEPLELIEAMGDLPAFCRGNIIKYVRRSVAMKVEERVDSLEKALNYLKLLIYVEQGGEDVKGFIKNGFERRDVRGEVIPHFMSLPAKAPPSSPSPSSSSSPSPDTSSK